MRIIVTGDRSWNAAELAEAVVKRLILRYGGDIVIVHGAAPGIDWSFTRACQELGVQQEAHPADWGDLQAIVAVVRQTKDGTRYNANAGPTRNAEMVADGAAMCIAFHPLPGPKPGDQGLRAPGVPAGRGPGRPQGMDREPLRELADIFAAAIVGCSALNNRLQVLVRLDAALTPRTSRGGRWRCRRSRSRTGSRISQLWRGPDSGWEAGASGRGACRRRRLDGSTSSQSRQTPPSGMPYWNKCCTKRYRFLLHSVASWPWASTCQMCGTLCAFR